MCVCLPVHTYALCVCMCVCVHGSAVCACVCYVCICVPVHVCVPCMYVCVYLVCMCACACVCLVCMCACACSWVCCVCFVCMCACVCVCLACMCVCMCAQQIVFDSESGTMIYSVDISTERRQSPDEDVHLCFRQSREFTRSRLCSDPHDAHRGDSPVFLCFNKRARKNKHTECRGHRPNVLRNDFHFMTWAWPAVTVTPW